MNAKTKKQAVAVKDLKTRKNPKGGAIKPKAADRPTNAIPAGEVNDCRPNVY